MSDLEHLEQLKKVYKECSRKLDIGRNETYKSLFMAYVYPETSTLKVITTARREYELCEGEYMFYLISFTKSGKVCWIKANDSEDKLEKLITKYCANSSYSVWSDYKGDK